VLVVAILHLESVLGFSASRTGVYFLPPAAMSVVGGIAGAQVVRRAGPRLVVPAGLVVAAGGTYWLSERLSTTGGYAAVFGPLLVFGLGLGAATVGATMAAAAAFGDENADVSSGTINSIRELGSASLLAIANSTLFGWFGAHAPALQSQEGGTFVGAGRLPPFVVGAWVEGEARALQVCALVTLAAAVVSAVWLQPRRRPADVH
jgi:hypothetical protein